MNLTRSKIIVASLSSAVIGLLSGLIGVGGGEFRLPILIGFLRLPVLFATATNLIIGVLVSATTFIFRFSLMTQMALRAALFLSVVSLIGGYLGATLSGKIKEHIISYILTGFLVLVGFKLMLATFLTFGFSDVLLGTDLKLFLLYFGAFFIGVISGLFGVAGGEFRIPLLMGFADMPIKLAGTVSTLVALPTQLGGLVKRCKLKHINQPNVKLAIVMGISSVVGSFFGAKLVFYCNEKFLEFTLGFILVFAAIGIFRKKHGIVFSK